MGLTTEIVCGEGCGSKMGVDRFNSAFVSNRVGQKPDRDTQNRVNYYRYFIDSMNVDGSSTAQTFELVAEQADDIIISSIVFVISDGEISNKKFGDIDALDNGFDLYVSELGKITYIIDSAKTNGEMFVASNANKVWGTADDKINKIKDWSEGSDGFLVRFDLSHIISTSGLEGIRLGAGTKDKFVLTVNDDLTGLDDFQVTFFGARQVA